MARKELSDEQVKATILDKLSKPTHYGREISLNPEKSQEILEIIEGL